MVTERGIYKENRGQSLEGLDSVSVCALDESQRFNRKDLQH